MAAAGEIPTEGLLGIIILHLTVIQDQCLGGHTRHVGVEGHANGGIDLF